jgi:type IV secretory pathway TraG/TraD family ATPase VirD4
LFIQNNIANTKYYAPLTSVLLMQFFNELMAELPVPGSLPVLFHIDEAASITCSGLPIMIANCRKYSVGVAMFYQSFHQMSHQYSLPEAKAIEANCWTKIYLPGTPIDIAAGLEKEMGVFEYESEQNTRRTRSLMTSSEIRECTDALVFCGAHRALRLPLRPYYSSRLKSLLSTAPFVPTERVITSLPPLIQFD